MPFCFHAIKILKWEIIYLRHILKQYSNLILVHLFKCSQNSASNSHRGVKEGFEANSLCDAHECEKCAQGRGGWTQPHVSSRDRQTRGLHWRAANYLQRRVNNRWQRDAANNRRHRCCPCSTQDSLSVHTWYFHNKINMDVLQFSRNTIPKKLLDLSNE